MRTGASSAAFWLAPVLVAVFAFLPFLPALDGEFLHWDDDVNFLANPDYRGLGRSQIAWMFTTTLSGHYIPLTWLTLGLNHVVGGMDPWGYHLGNLLLHAANAALLFFVATRLLAAALGAEVGRRDAAVVAGAAGAALVFAVHPLRVESVAWITERRDVLCGLFYLSALLAYLRGVAGGGSIRPGWRAVSLAAFAAALLSKGIAVTLPLSLLVLDVYPLRRRHVGWRSLLAEKLPYGILAALGGAAVLLAVDRGARWTPYGPYGVSARLAMTAYGLWFYPRKLVWSHDLSPLYELPSRVDPLGSSFIASAVGVAAVTLGLVLLRRRLPGALAAWAHSAIVVMPVSGILHAGNQLAHDRYSYLSGLGFAVLAGGALGWTLLARRQARLRPWTAAAVVGAAALVVIGWSVGTWRQCAIWRNSEALWRAAVDVDPRCAICRNNLGATLMVREPSSPEVVAEAETNLRQAIALRPGYPDPYRSLGVLYLREHRYGEAEAVFLAITRMFPDLPDGPARLAALRERARSLGRGTVEARP